MFAGVVAGFVVFYFTRSFIGLLVINAFVTTWIVKLLRMVPNGFFFVTPISQSLRMVEEGINLDGDEGDEVKPGRTALLIDLAFNVVALLSGLVLLVVAGLILYRTAVVFWSGSFNTFMIAVNVAYFIALLGAFMLINGARGIRHTRGLLSTVR